MSAPGGRWPELAPPTPAKTHPSATTRLERTDIRRRGRNAMIVYDNDAGYQFVTSLTDTSITIRVDARDQIVTTVTICRDFFRPVVCVLALTRDTEKIMRSL